MKKLLLLICLIISYPNLFSQTEKTVFLNSGKAYIGENPNYIRCALYIDRSFTAVDASLIQQNGQTVLKGNFYNNISSGNVFSPETNAGTGEFEFRGDKVQYIKGTADKAANYINFPDLKIANLTVVNNEDQDTAAVIVVPTMGLSTHDLLLYRGRLILDSEAMMNGATDSRTSNVAHLLVHNNVTYDDFLGGYDPSADDKNDRGIIQVKLAIGEHYKHGYLTGFTPPFQKIYNDYFFYNFITRPTAAGLFGDEGKLIINPKVGLTSGKGYILGFGIVPENDPYYQTQWDPQWTGTIYDDRFKDMMSFARNYAPDNLTQFVNEDTAINDHFSGEKINVQDVSIPLEDGWNYVGNPFTVPIDMSTFLDEATTADDWGITRGVDADRDVENKYYILTQGFGTYSFNSTYTFQFDVTYLVAQKEGSTITLDGTADAGLIAPMQLFVIKKNSAGNKNLIIPQNVRTHGNVNFLRSGLASPLTITDELLIEARDEQTKGYDRLCVVFRKNATTISNDRYDAAKIFNSSGGVNQIYTKSLDDRSMTTNVVPPTIEKLVMYFEPSDVEQEVTLGAHRISSLSSISTVILEDTKTGVQTNFLETPYYTFRSSPTDKSDRFILHFDIRGGENIENNENADNDILIFYNDGVISIEQLKSNHIGAEVSIFELNGRQIYKSSINQTPAIKILKYLPQGMYLVKVENEKSTVTKKLLIK